MHKNTNGTVISCLGAVMITRQKKNSKNTWVCTCLQLNSTSRSIFGNKAFNLSFDIVIYVQ